MFRKDLEASIKTLFHQFTTMIENSNFLNEDLRLGYSSFLVASLGFLVIRSPNILMGDVDYISLSSLRGHLEKVSAKYNLNFRVYSTNKGFHFIVTNRFISIRKPVQTSAWNEVMGICDPKYTQCCVKYGGYALRVSPKKGEVNPKEHVMNIGFFPTVNSEIGDFLKIHDLICLR